MAKRANPCLPQATHISPIDISVALHDINSYHHRLSNVWSFLYELRSHHIFWIDDVIGPVELDTTTIFNNQYGLVHSPSRSPERAGTPTQSPYKTYELNDNHNSDPLLLTSNAYLRYNDTGTNAAQILPDITRMDFIKSVVFLEKNMLPNAGA